MGPARPPVPSSFRRHYWMPAISAHPRIGGFYPRLACSEPVPDVDTCRDDRLGTDAAEPLLPKRRSDACSRHRGSWLSCATASINSLSVLSWASALSASQI